MTNIQKHLKEQFQCDKIMVAKNKGMLKLVKELPNQFHPFNKLTENNWDVVLNMINDNI